MFKTKSHFLKNIVQKYIYSNIYIYIHIYLQRGFGMMWEFKGELLVMFVELECHCVQSGDYDEKRI